MHDWTIAAVSDPLAFFDQWFREAEAAELNDPNAAALATTTPNGFPSVRMILAKQIDDPSLGHQRFCVFTNVHSRKGEEILANPNAALCFHWKSLRRQVRVEGTLHPLSAEASDTYFHSRSRGSQISAAVSDQSRPLASRALLENSAAAFTQAHPSEIPRPAHWRGFYLDPTSIEFWISGQDRLHDRILFTHDSTNKAAPWNQTRLYP